MLTKLRVYSSWRSAPTTLLLDGGRAETDLIQVLDVSGIDPPKASINRTSYGSVDGSSYTGGDIQDRNIVLKLGPNPDWSTVTPSDLRKRLYQYFMPKQLVRLVFESDDGGPVEISGIVESVSDNMFSKDLEMQVSIVCPDPYFTAVEATIVAGSSIRYGGDPVVVEYNGNIEAGFEVLVSQVSGSTPILIGVQIGNPAITYFTVDAEVDGTKYFDLVTVPLRKSVQNVRISDGLITNLLTYTHLVEGETWPMLQPGENEFSVITDDGVQDWELRYYERYGGL